MDNFGPLYVKNIFQLKQDDNATLCKVWVTLYTCAASRAVILNLTRHIDSHSFVRSFRLFIVRCGCPSNVISDSGRNFILDETFIHSLGVEGELASCIVLWWVFRVFGPQYEGFDKEGVCNSCRFVVW